MRTVAAAVLATTLLVSSAFAQTAAPLAPGKPAGVHKADLGDSTTLTLVAFGAFIGIGVALMSGTTSNSGVVPTVPVAVVSTTTTG